MSAEERPTMFKSTVVVWTEFDPRKIEGYQFKDLGEDVDDGGAYCPKWDVVEVKEPHRDPDWNEGDSFFCFEEIEADTRVTITKKGLAALAKSK